jgi:hypothetical protein
MLIDIFTDYIRNKKDLREYVELRKGINERGEFNNDELLKIQENLEKLQNENPEIYSKMYAVLEEIIEKDLGDYIDYPLNFARVILNMEKAKSLDDMYNKYKAELSHHYQTLN